MKLIIAVCCILFFKATFAQGKKEGLPVTVQVITSVNVQESSVELTGVSNSLDAEPGEVYIEIITPSGTTDYLTGRTDKKTGNYFIKYTPKAIGAYNITAFASDKKQSAKTTFEVSADIAVTETFKTFDDAKKKSLTTLESALNVAIAPMAQPDDIAKTKEEVKKVKQKMAAFDDSWNNMKQAVKMVQELAKKHPEIKKIVAPQLGQLGSLLDENNKFLTQMEKNLGTGKSKADDECQTLYRVSEGCALFSTVMNAASGGILKIAASIFIDKAWPKIAENMKNVSAYSDNDKFVFTQAGKTGLTAMDGLAAVQGKSFGAGMAGDLVQHVSNGLIKKLCAEFKGPVSGDYTLEFKKDGKTYLKYKLIYEGTMYVSCRKDKLQDASMPKLSGYVEGNVTKMEFTDDVWAVEDKSDWDEVKYERIPAPVMPYNASEKDPGFGAVARGIIPGVFYFPLQAQIVQEKMIIKLMPARSEFTDAFANRTVMVVRAKAKPHNVDGAVFQYPITTARFILTRSMRMEDKSPTVTVDIETKNGDKTIVKEFSRTESADADTKVDFNLKLKMFKAFDNAKK